MKILLTALILNLILISNVIAEWEECYSPRGGGFTSFAVEGDTILAGTMHAAEIHSGIYKSTDLGISWTKLKTNFDTSSFFTFFKIQNKIFVGTTSHLYFTTDLGNTWTESLEHGVKSGSKSLISYNESLLLASTDGLFKSTDMGLSWEKMNFTPNDIGNFRTLHHSNDRLWGTIGSLVFESIDSGNTWNVNGKIPPFTKIFALDGKLYSLYHNIYCSNDGGKSWDSISADIPRLNFATSWEYSDGKLYVGTKFSGIFESSDLGKSWKSYGLEFSTVDDMVKTKNGMVAVTYNTGILTTYDEGINWSKFGYELINYFNKIDFDDTLMVAATRDGLYKSIDSGKTWFYDHFNSCNVTSIVFEGQNQMVSVEPHISYADSQNPTYEPGGIYVSSDLGKSWIQKHSFKQFYPIYTLVYNKGRILSGTLSGLFVTDDFGDTWIETLRFKNYINQILVIEDDIYTNPYSRVYVSTDNGDTWSTIKDIPDDYHSGPTIRRVGNMIFVNHGDSHSYISYDLGKSWSFTDKAPAHLPHIVNKDSSIIFTIYDEKVLFSTDQGQTWIDYDVGLLSKAFRITFFGGYIIVENGNGMFRKKISDFEKITSVQNEVFPNSFSIHPNPATEYITITKPTEGSEPSEGSKIRIFNTLGECVISVETRHAVSLPRIDISLLPRGVYYLRMGNRTQIFVKV